MNQAVPPHNPDTGELIEHEQTAADGGRRYPSVTTLTDLVHMLNDGQFNADCAHDLQEMTETMEEVGGAAGAKIKGKITLTIDVERQHDGVYFFTPVLKIALPQEKAPRTIGWATADNRFTPNKPHQGNLFGTVRDVNATREVRG